MDQQNYENQIPPQLTDPFWKKCLLNDQTNHQIILEGIVNIRKYLSQCMEVNFLITNVLETEIHKPLLKYGKKLYEKILNGYAKSEQVECLHQVLWVFTNLCCGQTQNTNQILDLGIINFCKQLFFLQNYHNIICILFELFGNVLSDCSFAVKISFLSDPNFYVFMRDKYRNYVHLPNFHQNSAWAFCNIFKDFSKKDQNYSIQAFEDLIMSYFPIINDLLKIQTQDGQGRKNILYIFFYISKHQSFHANQSIQIIQPFLFDKMQEIRQLVVQIIGNFICYCDQGVDYALRSPDFLRVLFSLLKNASKSKFRKQAAWIISNIFAGTVNQVDKFVEIPGIFNQLHFILNAEQNQSVIKEIIWSVSNSFTSCSERAFEPIFRSSIIESLSLKLRECNEKVSFKIYSEAVLSYLKKFQSNPNLDFKIFNKNLNQIQLTLYFTLNNYAYVSQIVENTMKAQQKISFLLSRGPVTEQQMMNNHLETFKL